MAKCGKNFKREENRGRGAWLFFYLFFFFFFFESYDYCLWVQNPTCSSRYGIETTPNYPWEKANPPSPSGMEPTAHLAPNKKPLTS